MVPSLAPSFKGGLNMNILNLLCTFIILILAFIHPLIHKYNLSSYCGLGSVLGIDTDICEL